MALIVSGSNTAPEAIAQLTATILVVDDEPTLREMVGYNLRREGYHIELADNGDDALRKARQTRPDLIVLDVMLPGLDGLHVCQTLRAESNVPILLLSARGEEVDRVIGLEFGADDYLTKPFAMRELVARVRALIRRSQMASAGAEAPDGTGNRFQPVGDNLEIDHASRLVRRDGVAVAFKPKEFDLLSYLVRHPGVVLSRDALLREVWGYDYPIDTRTVDVHIRWLRSKIERDPGSPRRIETVRGYGYRFVMGNE